MDKSFADTVLVWFDQHGRKDLPWQHNPTPYRVWVSEIMLQQTQVATVIPYYQRFMQSFPDVNALANANQDAVLKHWAGLGYYSRARNLHAAAQQVQQELSGEIPSTLESLIGLSGIGRSTAGAILSLAYQQAQPILDGNVKRVLTRFHAISGWTGKSTVQKILWTLAEQSLPSLPKLDHKHKSQRNSDYTQAMMDLGATVCTRSKPSCFLCPLQAACKALQQGTPTDYPTPKPRKVIPDRQAVMLLVMKSENQVLLQKRPVPGIWGGLWSLPQFEDMNEATAWYEKGYGGDLEAAEKLSLFSHVFSHFRLHVQPIKITLPSKNEIKPKGIMDANDFLWYNSTTKFSGGLPAPIKKLFKRIQL